MLGGDKAGGVGRVSGGCSNLIGNELGDQRLRSLPTLIWRQAHRRGDDRGFNTDKPEVAIWLEIGQGRAIGRT